MKTTWFTRWFAPTNSKTNSKRQKPKPGFDLLEGRDLPAAGIQEQYMVELINRMRANPQQELVHLLNMPEAQAAMTYFNVDQNALSAGFQGLTAAPPLAYSDSLDVAATNHSLEMLKADKQSHQLPGEKSLPERIADANYGALAGAAENAFTNATSVAQAHAAFAIDWGVGPNGLQDPAGHRLNIMSDQVSDVGIGLVNSTAGKKSGPLIVTQNFARLQTPGDPYLLGVVFNDTNNNTFYDIGEGLKGVTVTITPQGGGAAITLTTSDAGYYQSQVPAGTYDVNGTGGGLVADITKTVTVAAVNVKADLVTAPGQPAQALAQLSLQAPVTIKEDAGTAQIKVTRSGDLNSAVTVPFKVTAGTGAAGATSPADYTVVTAGPFVFAATETEKIVEISIGDRPGVFTGDKSFEIELDPVPANATVLNGYTAATITDNDVATYAISFVNASGGEIAENVAGGNLQVKVVYTGAGNGTVKLETVDGTATGSAANAQPADKKDYTIVSQTLSFTGAGEQTVNVPIINNTVLNAARIFSVKLSSPTLGTLKSPSVLFATIVDDEVPPAVGASTAKITGPASIGKAQGGQTITVTRTGTTNAASVRIKSTGGTAAPGADYTAIDQVLTFAVGAATATATLTPTGNSTGDKTVELTLSDYVGVGQGTPNKLTVTIKDQNQVIAPAAPTGVADFFVIKKGDALSTAPTVLANDTGATSAKISQQPAGGTVTLAADGTFTFAPNANFKGIDRFTYKPSNGTDGNEITVTIMTHEALQVRKLYRQVLNREPDQGGWEGWTAQIQAGKASLGTVASGIFESAERLDPIITKYYQDYLSRTPDPAGLAGWRAQWQKDGGPENVIAGMIASPEYYAKAGGTDTGWINALYQSLLGRAAAAPEVNAWLQVLQAPGGTRQQVVFGFINSQENRQLLVKGWFQQYLNRAPSQAELDQYVGQMNAGGTQRSVQIALIDTQEYLNNPPPPAAGVGNRVT